MAASVSETELADLHRQIANMEKQVLTLVAQATDPSRSAEAQSNASALALTCHKKLHKLEAQLERTQRNAAGGHAVGMGVDAEAKTAVCNQCGLEVPNMEVHRSLFHGIQPPRFASDPMEDDAQSAYANIKRKNAFHGLATISDVELPSKRARTLPTQYPWMRRAINIPSFNPADGKFLRVPFVDVAGLSSSQSSNQQEVLYFCRTATPPEDSMLSSASTFALLVGGERNVLYEGPPGTGKYTLAWAAALQLVASGISVLWVHLERAGALCVFLQPTDPGSALIAVNYTSEIAAVENFLTERSAQRLFLDGAGRSALTEQGLFGKVAAWYRNDPARCRRVALISSRSGLGRLPSQEDPFSFRRICDRGWELEEYHACFDAGGPEFFACVGARFDALRPAVDAVQALGLTADERKALVNEKFPFAGASARYMFSFPTDLVRTEIVEYSRAPASITAVTQSDVGDKSDAAVHHLTFSKLAHGGTAMVIYFVSEFAAKLCAWKTDDFFFTQARKYEQSLGPSFAGHIFQADFIKWLEPSRHPTQAPFIIPVVDLAGNNVIPPWVTSGRVWSFYHHDDLKGKNFNVGDWFLPTKCNHACWNVAQLTSADELVVVHLTVAERTHSFFAEYLLSFVKFLNCLRAEENPPQAPIRRVQFYFIVPHGNQRKFQVPDPQGWNTNHSDWAIVLPDLPANTFVAGFIRSR